MSEVFRTIIIPATQAEIAREHANLLSDHAEDMWTVGLSESGNLPATHYVSSGYISEQFTELLVSAEALQAATNLPLEQCQAFVNGSDISEDEPFDAFERLGLKLIQI